MKIPNLNYKTTTTDQVLEIILLPWLLIIPFFVLRELMGRLDGDPSLPLLWLSTLLVTFFLLAVFHLKGLREKNMPLPLFGAVYLAETAIFVCFFIIFRSKESFRLPQQTLFAMSVSFAIAIFFIQAALRGVLVWRRNYLNLPIIMMLIFAALSFFLSKIFLVSLQDFVELFCIIALFWLIVNSWSADRHFAALGVIALSIGGLMSLIGTAQHFNFTQIYGLERNLDMFSTLGNKNYVAELMAMLLPFALAMLAVTEGLWRKLLIWLAIENMLVIVVISQTRGSWFGLGLGLVVLVLYGLDNFDRRRSLILLGVVAGFILNALLIMYLSQKQHLFYKGPTDYANRFLSMMREVNSLLQGNHKMGFAFGGAAAVMAVISQLLLRKPAARIAAVALIVVTGVASLGLIKYVRAEEARNPSIKAASEIDLTKTTGAPVVLDDSIASRRFIYGGTFQIIKHYPLGTGIGTYKTKYLSMLKDYLREKNIKTIPGFFKDVNAKEAHNEYLHTLTEQGPIGLLILLFFILRLIIYFYRVYYRKSDEYTRMLVLGAFSGLAAIGGAAMLGFPFRIVPTAVVCGLLIATIVFGEDRAALAERAQSDRPLPLPDEDPRHKRGMKLDAAPGISLTERAQSARSVPLPDEDPQHRRNTKSDAAPGIPLAERAQGFRTLPMPDEDPRRRRFVKLDALSGISLATLAIIVFAVISIYAYRWQEANIVMKEGEAWSRNRNFKEAETLFKQSMDLDPSNGEIYFSLGMLYQSMADSDPQTKEQNLDKSIDYFQRSLSYYELPMARLNLGAAYFQKGELYIQAGRSMHNKEMLGKGTSLFEKAKKEFDETISLYPNYSLPWFNLGLMEYEYGENALAENNRNEANKRYKSAEEYLKKTMDIDPGLVMANFKLGLVYERLGRQDDAMKQYEKTVNLPPTGPNDGPTLADAAYNLGIIYYNRSVELSKQASKPGLTDAQRTQLSKQSVDLNFDSQKMFFRTIEMNPNHTKALNNLGNILYQQGNVDDALSNYNRALDVDPSYVEPKLNIPNIYIDQQRYPEALAYINDLKKIAMPIDKQLKVLRLEGMCYLRLGQLDKADAALSQMVNTFRSKILNAKLTPDQVADYGVALSEYGAALTNLAETKKKLNDTASAMKLLQEAVTLPLDPMHHIDAFSQLAMMQAQSKNIDGAKATLEKARALYEAKFYDLPAYGNLALEYSSILAQQNNNTAQALAFLQQYSKKVTNPNIKAALNQRISQYGQFQSAMDKMKQMQGKNVVINQLPVQARSATGTVNH